MVFTFALLLASLPAVTGWGFITIWLLGRLKVPSPYRFDLLTPIIGLATLAVLVNIENFFYPVSFEFAIAIVLVGWIVFLLNLRRFVPFISDPLWIGAVLFCIGVIAPHAVLQAWNYDSGLYHIPSIRWLVDSAIPFGLANLHGRLGFNSAWFSVSAVLAQATAPYTPNYTALASETLFAAFEIAVLVALYKFVHNKGQDIATIFLVASGMIGFSPELGGNLSSPSADHPVLLLALILVYVFLRAIETQDRTAFLYEFWLCVFLTLFAVTIKISMLPLVLIPLAMIFIGYRWHFGIKDWKTLLPAAITTMLVSGVWLARGLVLSGCFIYPVSLTCIWSLPWAVTRAQAENEALYIRSWAREPRVPPATVLASWDWVGPWWMRLVNSTDFILPLVCLGIGLVLMVILWQQVKAQRAFRMVVVLTGISFIGLFYWFVTAPDLRFGSTWFWVPGLLALATAAMALYSIPRLNVVLRFVAIVILVVSSISIANVGLSYIQRAGWSYTSALYIIPPMPKPDQVEVKKTDQGIPVNIVTEGRCYWTAPFCTPYFQSNLTMARGPNYRLFIYAGK